jgi:basic amino acid/polyamine antiporter, APA family
MRKFKRELTLFDLVDIGISQIIGVGIFVVIGIASGIAGPSVILAFWIAGFIALLTALTTAELSSIITETGSSYAYAKMAFGKFFGFLVGWMRYFDNVVSISAVALGFSAYLISFFFPHFTQSIFIISSIVLIILLTIPNILGAKITSRISSILVLIKLSALSFLIFTGMFYLLGNFDKSKFVPLFPNGFSSTLTASSLVFFAFLGFQTVAMASEEAKNPKRDVPLAIIISLLICSLIYIAVAIVSVGSVDWKILGSLDHPLSYVAQKITNNEYASLFVTFGALVATASVALTSIYSSSRTIFALSRDNLLPKTFAKISEKFRTPITSVLVSSLLSILIVLSGSINFVVSIVSFGSLFNFIFTNLSLIKIKKKIKKRPAFELPFHPLIPIAGTISCFILMFFLENSAKIAGTIWLLIGILIYLMREKIIK